MAYSIKHPDKRPLKWNTEHSYISCVLDGLEENCKGSVEAQAQGVIKKSNSIKAGIEEKKVIMDIKNSKYFSWKEKLHLLHC